MKKYDVFGVGNALVDIIVFLEDQFLQAKKLQKGIMTLMDESTQGSLLSDLHEYKKNLRSGGSAANTMIALANSGGTGCYTGKVSHDTYGEFYKKDIEEAGIVFETKPDKEGHTGTCLILTTPDAERTMLTSLGISITLKPEDIDQERLKASQFVYVEGYLWDGVTTKAASELTMKLAKENGVKVSFTYSDPFCVNRAKEEFIKLTKEYVDVVFCNLEEAYALTGKTSPIEALEVLGTLAPLCFMTAGREGSYVIENGKHSLVPGFPVKPLDTTGAGDSFAAGVLYGLTHGYSPEKSARWGNYVASRVVQEVGPRLTVKLMGRQDEILTGM
ncbi:adenosine kinase [Leptospira sp. GIMC2001]|uniref:adenosine kinase n=1 Tax=Leptospira sp. GIMC2001 TaxID=1513297 RepID=UPI0004A5C41C|nr:adenosine kinase [Leptospira sp. GIMC2001]AID56158.1 fructokinase [Leptospira sp. GIMC2001]WCL50026.1 adenosine kinase [Leptospira sp. GIMC2001]